MQVGLLLPPAAVSNACGIDSFGDERGNGFCLYKLFWFNIGNYSNSVTSIGA
jgi:hypothetical protein